MERWRASKTSILDFVARVTTKNDPYFVPVEQRIATFDNDGTLWVEQPMYVQLAFALDRVKALAPMYPEPREAVECTSANAAIRGAERMARAEGNVGAVAFSRTGDPASGEFADAVLLKAFGEVPSDLSAL